MSIEQWYSELTQIASRYGTAGLPAQADIQALFEAGFNAQESYDQLYPPAPVTLQQESTQAAVQLPYHEGMTGAQADALILAQSIETPRVTEQDILNKIIDKTFTLMPSGRTIICEITMTNGFTFQGKCTPVVVDEKSTLIAQAKALVDAVHNAWPYYGFLLREELYRAELARVAKQSLGIAYQAS